MISIATSGSMFWGRFASASCFNWVVQAYCLMSNHYHLLVQTPDANLAAGMRHLNGVYTQLVNRRHARVGHVFQGRYKAVLVDREAHLLEVARYVVLNPVRAAMVSNAAEWPWSSHRAVAGTAAAPVWLDVDALLAPFGRTRAEAVRRYRAHVQRGVGMPSIWQHLRQQIYLGDDDFVEWMQRQSGGASDRQLEVPRAQRRAPAAPLQAFVKLDQPRDEAIANAYATGAYSQAEIARAFGVHYSTVSRAVTRLAPRTQSPSVPEVRTPSTRRRLG